ncbi:MAG: pantoate--beta-alanine ligase [Bacteroidaceae bacterium]|nr:pantoate--beta-alanine ligase [Bacteroidaceae bacterium]
MKIVQQQAELAELVREARLQGATIGLVPTMGALHRGHASLITRSAKECDLTIVTIFVNPTQFNDPNDLKNYPRTFEADCEMVQAHGGNVIFAPSIDEIYPEPDQRQFAYPPIDTVMEGARRPGHFNGVCQIVSKLFSMTMPDRAYFGEKDFQQIAVVRAMMDDLGFDFELVPCPIVREASGLAMSSRNELLTSDERVTAAHISRVLFESREFAKQHDVAATRKQVIDQLNAIGDLEVEYFDIVDAHSLQSVESWEQSADIQGCITVYCGSRPVRLIDNIAYRRAHSMCD